MAQHDGSSNGFASSTGCHHGTAPAETPAAPAPDPGAVEDLVSLLVNEDDDAFREDLLELTQADEHGPHLTLLWHPRILARFCALPDAQFTFTVLLLAQPEYAGLDILFDDRLTPRLAQVRPSHLRGTLLPYARKLPGFHARDFLAMLHTYQAAHPAAGLAAARPLITSMDTVERQPVTWLWWPYIAIGKLTMLDGEPGSGKSLLLTQLAANLSRGLPLPDQDGVPTLPTGGAHTTVLLATEDGLADTLGPRLDAAGADSSKIKVLTGWVDGHGDTHAFTFQHMPMLERTLQEYQPTLVVIDPLQAYLGSRLDMHRANETRPLLEALRRLAEQYQCAIVCVRHPAKASQGSKAIHRGLGSIDLIGAGRTGLFVEQHPSDPTLVLLAQSKSNIGPLGQTQVFRKADGHFRWHGTSRLSAEMLAGAGRGPDPHTFLDACCWLEARLQDGLPVRATELREEAEEQEEISFPTLRRAKRALGVKSRKSGESWFWHLPARRGLPTPQPLHSLASLDLLEPLELLQETQGVSVPEDPPAGPGGGQGGCASLREPGEEAPPEEALETPEPVENVEEAQETQAAQPVPAPLNGQRQCRQCRTATTWVVRSGIPFCSKCHTPARRAR